MRHRDLLATCVAAAARAADAIRAKTPELSTIEWQEKSSTDFVSEVDLAAESLAREVVVARHPDAVVVAEESSPEAATGAPLAFVVDPLDGTTNFLHGYPEYAVSIAAVREGVPVAGTVLNGATGELFTATAGGGTRRNGEPVRVSAIEQPSRALVGTGFPFKHPEQVEPYLAQMGRVIRATSGIRRAGAAALDLADVACGRFEAFWELSLAPWDIAAGILLVREAGGRITDLAGRDAPIAHGPIVAGNPAMHAWLLRTLHEEPPAERPAEPPAERPAEPPAEPPAERRAPSAERHSP